MPEELTSIRINWLSGVDRPAQKGARALMLKRRAPEPKDETLWKDGTPGVLTSETEGHTHIVWLHGMVGETTMQRSEGDEGHHDHPWTLNADGSLTIGANDGHDHTVGQEAVMAALVAMQKAEHDDDDDAGRRRRRTRKEHDMPNDTTLAKLEQRLAASEARAQKAEERAELQLLLAGMTDIHKRHFDTLDEAAKATFAKRDTSQRQADLDVITKAADAADPVLYTCDDGIEIRKSDGKIVVALAKRADEADRRAEKAEGTVQESTLRKRAETDLASLPGTLDEKVAMLKGIDTIPAGAARDAAMSALRAGDAAIAKAFTRTGHQGDLPEGTPQGDLDVLAKRHQEANPDETPAMAMEKVLSTPEGKRLYAANRRANPAQGPLQ